LGTARRGLEIVTAELIQHLVGEAPTGNGERSSIHPRLSSKLTKEEKLLMCRNIKTLHNFKPPATEEEIRASSLQFVRKLSGFTKPSKANEEAFNLAVEQVAKAATHLLESLTTSAPPRDRDVEAEKARARSADRFSQARI